MDGIPSQTYEYTKISSPKAFRLEWKITLTVTERKSEYKKHLKSGRQCFDNPKPLTIIII